jgi:hypothetical protein
MYSLFICLLAVSDFFSYIFVFKSRKVKGHYLDE